MDGPFQALCRTIIYQQLAGAAAATIHGRFLALLGGEPAGLHPAALLAVDVPRLRAVGLSERKTEYLRDLATHVHEGRLQVHLFGTLPDEVIAAQLQAVRACATA